MRTRPIIVVVLLACVGQGLVAPARAQAPASLSAEMERRLDQLSKEAIALYGEKKYDQAAAKLISAITIYPAAGLLYNLGRIYEEQGKWMAAREKYQECLKHEPDPEIEKMAKQHIEMVSRNLDKGFIHITGEPEGALVSIDQVARGKLPLEPLELTAGEHELEVTLAGYATLTAVIVVPPAGQVQRFVRLEKASPQPVVVTQSLYPKAMNVAGWVTLGTGVAMLAGGTVLWWLGDKDWQDVNKKVDGAGGNPIAMSAHDALAKTEAGDRKHYAGIALWTAGGAAAAASVVLLVLDALNQSHAPVVTPTIGWTDGRPGQGLTLQVGGRF